MIGRTYLDGGSVLGGRFDPPVPVVVLQRWGPGGGPRNVLVRYPDGREAVIPLTRRLRRPRCGAPACDGDLSGRRPQTRYCDTRCRVAALRARRADGQAAKPLQAPPARVTPTTRGAVTVTWPELVAAREEIR